MLSEIYNFHIIDEKLATGGQPTGEQMQDIHDSGYEISINLALPSSDKAIANEGSIVTGLGISYIHIPVIFENPSELDFNSFCNVMEAFKGRKIFVHCAANFRVSAFIFLYRVSRLHVPAAEAEKDLHAIWQPDEVWTKFIREQLKAYKK